MAIEYDGTGDHIDAGNDATLTNVFDGGGSVALWIYIDDETKSDAIVSKGSYSGNTGWVLGCDNVASGNPFNLVLRSGWSGNDGVWVSPSSLSEDTWYHVAIVYNADATSNEPVFYLDGVVVATTESTEPTGTRSSDSGESLHIGEDPAAYSDLLGKTSDFRMFGGSLTLEQLARVASGYRGPIGGEICWLGCDQAEGVGHWDGATLSGGSNFLPDKSLNSNRGNPAGNPTARASDAPFAGTAPMISAGLGIVTQAIAGTITNTGSLILETRKVVAGTLTNTGVLINKTLKIFVGSITNTGTLVRKTNKIAAGAITNTGALVRATRKVVAGSITNTGALTTVKAVLQKFYTWTASFRASDREDPYHAGSDEKRGRA